MGWIDRHKRHGIVLALLALALQMAIAFGHVHLRGSAQLATATITHRIAGQSNSQTPAQIPGDNDDYCAACAAIFLASTAFARAPPQLPPPTDFETIEHSIRAELALAERPRLAFRSRAPPLV
jgi:hypothetical protein